MWQVRGQEGIVTHLQRGLDEGRLSHAYLLVGPPHVGKGTLAQDLACAVNCLASQGAPCGECSQCLRVSAGQHADVVWVGAQGRGEEGPGRRETGIDDVRGVQHQASLKPYEGRQRVFIFDGAEGMSDEAANALLKTLEEPPPEVTMILLAGSEDSLLPTIRSRCRVLELRPMPMLGLVEELVETRSLPQEEAEELARLSMGCLGWALGALDEPSILEKRRQDLERILQVCEGTLEERFAYGAELATLFYRNREEARELLGLWVHWWRDLLLLKEGADGFLCNYQWRDDLGRMAAGLTTTQVVGTIHGVLRTLEALDHNANPRLALDVLMLGLPGMVAPAESPVPKPESTEGRPWGQPLKKLEGAPLNLG